MSSVNVIAKCVDCGKKRKVKAGEVEAGDMPMCNDPKCGGVMVAHKAEASVPFKKKTKKS